MDEAPRPVTRWLERARVTGAAACFAAAGGLSLWGLGGDRPTLARAAVASVAITVDATEVPKGASVDATARRLAARWEEAPLTIALAGEPPLTGTRRSFGARIDLTHLTARLRAAADSTSALRRFHGEVRGQSPLEVPLPIVLDEAALFERLADLKDRYDRRPRDARVRSRDNEILPHQDGRVLDVHGTLDAVHEAFDEGASRVEALVRHRPAGRTSDQLAGLDLAHVLGSFETRYANTEESRDRSFNLGVAAEKVDGLVILPGETFDFNAAVGERSEANGFRPAPVIEGGELVDGVGGGTCQVAGTLHSAAFFAGLAIEEREPHSRPSSYLYMGLDAVVSYPQRNLRIRNDLSHPVAIGFSVEGGIARAEIRGAPTARMVSLVRRIDEVLPYDEREVQDPSLPRGVRVLRQRGAAGFRITSWRIVRDVPGRHAERTRREDTYPATTQIWRVGSGGSAPEGYVPPEGDTHGEYTADAYLEVVQGHGVRGMQVTRAAGVSGTPGWTARQGFPQ